MDVIFRNNVIELNSIITNIRVKFRF